MVAGMLLTLGTKAEVIADQGRPGESPGVLRPTPRQSGVGRGWEKLLKGPRPSHAERHRRALASLLCRPRRALCQPDGLKHAGSATHGPEHGRSLNSSQGLNILTLNCRHFYREKVWSFAISLSSFKVIYHPPPHPAAAVYQN